jgi:hypothetical protein
MVRMMIPSEGAANNIGMVFAGLPVDGRRPILIEYRRTYFQNALTTNALSDFI